LFLSVEHKIVNRTAKVIAIAEMLTEGSSVSEATLRIRGECMAPTLVDGMCASVGRASIVLPGDIVVFRTSTDLTAHRVLGYWVRAWKLALVTKGDHCDRHDGVIELDRVIGRIGESVSIPTRLRSFGAFLRLLVSRAGRRT
jgi:hypothetical protein